jgi:integrase
MARGSALIRYDGKRAVVWRVKYVDANGRHVVETLGREPKWNEKRAYQELGKREQLVERERYAKPRRLTFTDFAERFKSEYLPGRGLKKSTLLDYEHTIDAHLVPFFAGCDLVDVEMNPEKLDAYIAAKATAKPKGLSPKTIRSHLGVLRIMFKVAIRWRLARSNPVRMIDLPRADEGEMNVLTEVEIARLLTAYSELEANADEDERPWWRLSRRIVEVALGTALRRGELLALRWRDVKLLGGMLSVRESYVRNEFTTPKSRKSRRTMELGPRTLASLQARWQETLYTSDSDLVFCHALLGTPLDGSKISREFMRPALVRAEITKPFRPWHDLRHTALTHEAAAGNPQAYLQMKAGHSQGTITERYIHAAQVLFPGAAERGEERLFGALVEEPG